MIKRGMDFSKKHRQFCKHGHDTYKLGRDNHGGCSECGRIRHKKHYHENPEHYRNYKSSKRLKRYGISKTYYDELLKSQNNACAICNGVSTDKSLSIDHDHKTGYIRGLLCQNCNIMLGLAKDSCDILKRAITYLNHKD